MVTGCSLAFCLLHRTEVSQLLEKFSGRRTRFSILAVTIGKAERSGEFTATWQVFIEMLLCQLLKIVRIGDSSHSNTSCGCTSGNDGIVNKAILSDTFVHVCACDRATKQPAKLNNAIELVDRLSK